MCIRDSGCAAALSAFALILAFFVVHDDEETKRRRAQIKEQRKTFSPQAVKQN